MEKKIKLVFISGSELDQRAIDYTCMDKLCNDFDLEYWDCTDFIYLPLCFENKLDRNYLRKIHSIDEFRQNLNRIPVDSIVIVGFIFCERNRKVLKALSKRFPTIVRINSFANTPYSYNVKEGSQTATSAYRRLISAIKKPFYNSSTIKTLIKILFHPHHYRVLVNRWQFEKETNRFERVIWFSCARNAKYSINHPDVEQYVRLKHDIQKRNDRYIVYIDQYFPYHKDLKYYKPDINQSQLAEEFFPSMNRYFDFLEKQYDCKVIIAVHPMANYQGNPYEGREMCSFQTAALVRDSIGVCMHSSNALSFVMLFDKPVVSLINGAICKVPRLNNQVLNVTNDWHISLVDTDMFPYAAQPMQKVGNDCRQAYIDKYFGDFEAEGQQGNAELFKEHYISVFNSLRREETVEKK